MAKLRLNGDTSGYMDIQPPAVADNSTLDLATVITSANATTLIPVKAGTVLEHLSSICDGSSVTVDSGTYTFADVTALQNSTTSFVDITGSSISYTPPSEATRVEYEFCFQWRGIDNGGINHFQPLIDGNIVYKSCRTNAGAYQGSSHTTREISIKMVIDCAAASTDASEAKFISWTTPKTLKVQFRTYNTSYDGRVHFNTWWNGAGATSPYDIAKPYLTIRAIK